MSGDVQFAAQGLNDFADRSKIRIAVFGQRFIQARTSNSSSFGNFGHPLGTGSSI